MCIMIIEYNRQAFSPSLFCFSLSPSDRLVVLLVMTLYHIITVIIIVIAIAAVAQSSIVFNVILDKFHPHREHIKSNSVCQMSAIIQWI